MTDTRTSGDTGGQPPAPPAPAADKAPWSPPPKRRLTIVLIVLVAIVAFVLILAAWGIWPFQSLGPRTEDAYVKGRTTVVAPQVDGYIQRVFVRDYAIVRRGQPLFQIDPSTYRAQVAEAKAQLDLRIADLDNNRQSRRSALATLQGKIASLGSAEAQLARDAADRNRDAALVTDGSVSRKEYEEAIATERQARAAVVQARADIAIARQSVRSTGVQREGLVAQVESARAQLLSAQISLSRTNIVAPSPGQLGEVGAHIGQYVGSGTQLTSLVPPGRWVIANYKEARTHAIRVGQHATVRVDALGGRAFDGFVHRISPATGSEFSAIKPDNATGNFVKVPQRIGVLIAIRAGQPGSERIAPGMSVEAVIDTTLR